MRDNIKSLRESLTDFFGSVLVQVRAALSVGTTQDDGTHEAGSPVEPDFEGWLHNDPMVTGDPASRYGDDAPGYLTSNGLGSLEIGAADD
jgi:hypothetical protein